MSQPGHTKVSYWVGDTTYLALAVAARNRNVTVDEYCQFAALSLLRMDPTAHQPALTLVPDSNAPDMTTT